MDARSSDVPENGLTRREIGVLIYKWIGVSGGYLGDFSYASHRRFWLEACDINVDTGSYPGTTREHFEETLFTVNRLQQAAALRLILEDYPVGSAPSRTDGLERRIRSWITRLETGRAAIDIEFAQSQSDLVNRALADADALLKSSGPQSAVDRVHTAMHGYLKSVCDEASIGYPDSPTMTQLLKALRSGHPAFADEGPREDDIRRVMNSLGSILDALNPVRNWASVAHPNEELLGPPEAMLVVNTVRTLMAFLEDKLAQAKRKADGL